MNRKFGRGTLFSREVGPLSEQDVWSALAVERARLCWRRACGKVPRGARARGGGHGRRGGRVALELDKRSRSSSAAEIGGKRQRRRAAHRGRLPRRASRVNTSRVIEWAPDRAQTTWSWSTRWRIGGAMPRPAAERRRCDYVIQAATHGRAHRGHRAPRLKPQLFCLSAGRDARIKVLDFGISKSGDWRLADAVPEQTTRLWGLLLHFAGADRSARVEIIDGHLVARVIFSSFWRAAALRGGFVPDRSQHMTDTPPSLVVCGPICLPPGRSCRCAKSATRSA